MTGAGLTGSGVTEEGMAGIEMSVALLTMSGKVEVDSTDSEITGTDLNVWEMTSVDLTGTRET